MCSALVRAGAGFALGTLPLFFELDRDTVTAVVDLRRDPPPTADHYSMLVGEYAASTVAAIDWLLELDSVAILRQPPCPKRRERGGAYGWAPRPQHLA